MQQRRGLHRGYSERSQAAMYSLQEIASALLELEELVDGLAYEVKAPNCSDETLVAVKNRLAILNGDVEKLQAKKIDGVATTELTSGQSEARTNRKLLNQRCEAILARITVMHKDCTGRIGKNMLFIATSPTSQTSGGGLQRGLSDKSAKAFKSLAEVRVAIDEAEEEFLELKMRALAAESQLKKADENMSALSRRLQVLQLDALDGASGSDLQSGREGARALRKELNAQLQRLLGDVDSMLGHHRRRG